MFAATSPAACLSMPLTVSLFQSTVVDCFRRGRRRLNADLVLAVVHALHPDVGYVAQWGQALRVVGGEVRAASQVRVQGTLPPEPAQFTGRTAEVEEIRQALTAAYGGSETLERQEERAAARHLLQVQREAARAAAAQGQIAEDTLGVLLKEIDQDLARVEQEIQADG